MDQRQKVKSVKLSERKLVCIIMTLLGNGFLNMTPKVQATKAKAFGRMALKHVKYHV